MAGLPSSLSLPPARYAGQRPATDRDRPALPFFDRDLPKAPPRLFMTDPAFDLPASGPEPVASRGLRDALRRGTRDAHARLDATLAELDLAEADDYGRFLLASARVVPSFESALERGGIATLLDDWPARRRRDALAGDLRHLGLTAPPPLPAPLPSERHGLLGVAYALEGSRNGAALLRRCVERSGEPRLRGATAFLRHGEGSGLWRSFLAHLEAGPTALPELSAALAGARSVFSAYLTAFGEPAAGTAGRTH